MGSRTDPARLRSRLFGVLGAVSGLLAVGLGAFGAHGLEGRLTPARLETFEIAVRYQMYHALALLVVSLLLGSGREGTQGALRASGWCFLLGTVLFSGSLYLLVATGLGFLGAVTPLGGLSFLAGWLLIAISYRGMEGENPGSR